MQNQKNNCRDRKITCTIGKILADMVKPSARSEESLQRWDNLLHDRVKSLQRSENHLHDVKKPKHAWEKLLQRWQKLLQDRKEPVQRWENHLQNWGKPGQSKETDWTKRANIGIKREKYQQNIEIVKNNREMPRN